MDPVKQNNSEQKVEENNRIICFTCTSNPTSAVHITFEMSVRYLCNTPARFITLLHRSKLQTPLYTILQKKRDYYREMQGTQK